jgi:hypothetical protein
MTYVIAKRAYVFYPPRTANIKDVKDAINQKNMEKAYQGAVKLVPSPDPQALIDINKNPADWAKNNPAYKWAIADGDIIEVVLAKGKIQDAKKADKKDKDEAE